MTTIAVRTEPAPSTPLNLRFGVTYAPRVPTPPLAGYCAVEVAPDTYEIYGYAADGSGAVLYRGGLWPAFAKLALHLRMDI